MSFLKNVTGSLDLPSNEQIDANLENHISDLLDRMSQLGLPMNWRVHENGCIYYVENDESRDFKQDIKALIYVLSNICPDSEFSKGIKGGF